MAVKREIIGPKACPANRILSPGVRVGDFIWTAGHVGRDPQTGQMPPDIKGQTRQTLENIRTVLEAGGASLGSVVKVNIYLKDIADRDAANEVYTEFFPTDPPGRTAIGGAQFGPNVLIEIEAIAVAES